MKSELNELIEILEAERLYIENCLKDNLDENEYLHAHHHSQAIFRIDIQLRNLYKFKDPNYDEKLDVERMIRLFKSKIPRSSQMTDYYEEKIKEEEEKLKKLNEGKNRLFYDDQQLDDALFNLLEGKHLEFIFYLNIKENLGFTFKISEDETLEISVNIKNLLKAEYFLLDNDETPLNMFKSLGFILNHERTKLVYKYDMRNFKSALQIKILLSRIIYDVFAYAEIDNPATLIYL